MLLVFASLAAVTAEGAAVVAAVQLRPVPLAAVTVPLMVAVFFLLRSFTKQLKRIDFNDEAETDEGRMAPRPGDDQRAER